VIPAVPQPDYPLKMRPPSTGLAALDLTLLQPCGEPAAGVTLSVSPPQFGPPPFGGEPMVTDTSGRIVLTQFSAGVEVQLHGNDELGHCVLDTKFSLRPDETRALTCTIERDLHTVVVHVRNAQGSPVTDAIVMLLAAATRKGERSEMTSQQHVSAEGDARFPSTAAESISIAARCEGLAPAWLTDVSLDQLVHGVVLTLQPGHPVDVEIVDEAGRPRRANSVRLRGSPLALEARHVDGGHFIFDAYPESANGIVAIMGKCAWTIEHSANEPSARIELPASGALALTWDPAELDCNRTELCLSGGSLAQDLNLPVYLDELARGGPRRIDDLLPGDYSVRLACIDDDGEWRNRGTARVTVVSTVTTPVVLEP